MGRQRPVDLLLLPPGCGLGDSPRIFAEHAEAEGVVFVKRALRQPERLGRAGSNGAPAPS
eukprot:767406-Hanusia_phi.AAC.2